MLSKVCASWLIVLVLLPFTAPFATLDLSDLLVGRIDRGLGSRSSKTPTAALTHAAPVRVTPFPVRAVSRLRPALTRLRGHHAAALDIDTDAAPSGAVPIHVVHPASRATVLRI